MKNFFRIVMVLCAITTHFALSGCGSGGAGGSQNAGVTTVNSFSLTDNYGFEPANFMSAENNGAGGFYLRVSNTEKITPENSGDIFRINFLNPSSISGIGTYSIGDNKDHPSFPGNIVFFNCKNSDYLQTTEGTITFTSYGVNSGEVVAGSFDVQVEDRDPAKNSSPPYPTYHITGSFSFLINSSVPISPPPTSF